MIEIRLKPVSTITEWLHLKSKKICLITKSNHNHQVGNYEMGNFTWSFFPWTSRVCSPSVSIPLVSWTSLQLVGGPSKIKQIAYWLSLVSKLQNASNEYTSCICTNCGPRAYITKRLLLTGFHLAQSRGLWFGWCRRCTVRVIEISSISSQALDSSLHDSAATTNGALWRKEQTELHIV